MSDAPDKAERERGISARDKTVLIDAGAGAGKTTLLVARILALVAPPRDEDRAVSLSRIAAVTFTRRAAGELRLRVRERVLAELTRADQSPILRQRLIDALQSIESAFIGTIHGFADRLLRLQPMQARLSPAYQIVDDIGTLVEETFGQLLHAVQSGTLSGELEGMDPTYIAAVERTFQEGLRAGLLVRTVERYPRPPRVGLDALVRAFIEHRDRDLASEETGQLDRVAFDATARAYLALAHGIEGDQRGPRWMRRLATRIATLIADPDDCVLFELVGRVRQGLKEIKKTKDFERRSPARAAWDEFEGELAEQLTEPLQASMARRLAHARRAVVHLYERVKTRHEVLDPIDLLLILRNLVRDNLESRGFYQQMFDHVLVDELQDTDPLQAEVVLYLAEATPLALRWQDVIVGPGRLTLVGDPKQSIYRFRRADIGMYDLIRKQVQRTEHEEIRLTANFRSVPALIEWANGRFADILGSSTDQFDPQTGRVFHQPQQAGVTDVATEPPVQVVPYAFADGEEGKAADARSLEGSAISAYLDWLVTRSGITIRDPDSNSARAIQWGDVAVLALVTTNLRMLFDALDAREIPYAMAGGSLFASDPLHQQFVLGLRALADRNDGVAEAALLRPPFFAVDLLDLVREKAGADDPEAGRARAAREWIREARRLRFSRSPGHTARALLEDTGFGRAVALGANGEQRLRHLRELCLQLELGAANDGLDYDGVTAQLREWIDHPPQLDPPRPVGAAALQVLTVHQAKGLEFPIVVLWDGMGKWRSHDTTTPWQVDRDGAGWAMKLDGLEWQEPEGVDRLDRERQYSDAERQRLVYVAATRARDLLVIPRPVWEQKPNQYIHARLTGDAPPTRERIYEPYVEGIGASWSTAPVASGEPETVREVDLLTRWSEALAASREPRAVPASVTGMATNQTVRSPVDESLGDVAIPRKPRIGRFGPIFGETVHRAIALVVGAGWTAADAVASASSSVGLNQHHDAAITDVERALVTLQREGLLDPAWVRRFEYPVATHVDGSVVSGFIDLACARAEERLVLDFKTDHDPGIGGANAKYTAQVHAYGRMIGAARVGLLYTATGRLEWQ